MKVIIEGCDLTGKTTLIKKIKNYYNDDRLSYLHFSYKDRTDYQFYNTMLDKENFIADRHFIDEMIYPKIFKRQGSLSYNDFYDLIDKCKSKNIKILILTCSDAELLKRLNTRGENEEAVRNNLLKINKIFIDLAKQFNLQLCDTTKDEFENIINYIEGEENEKYKSYMHK